MARAIPKYDHGDDPGEPAKPDEYHIKLITPMFGGGAEAGVNDVRMPIRATAIRGQLQFWWRATRGAACPSPEALWRRQEEIFGSAEFPSPVDVLVSDVTGIQAFDPKEEFDRFGAAAYALFAAIENGNKLMKEGLGFKLHLRVPDPTSLRSRRAAQNEARRKARLALLPADINDIRPDVEAALDAWLAFGGVGARTRRGAGAISSERVVHAQHLLKALGARMWVGEPTQAAVKAWTTAVDWYKKFRQSPRGAVHRKTLRNGKVANVPGRSHWPEADSIRHVSGCALRPGPGQQATGVPADEDTHDHSAPVVPQEILPAFPKAVLGLPINFHFADGPSKHAPGRRNLDPQDAQIVPHIAGARQADAEGRLASPVITRPVLIDGRWHPAVLILPTCHIEGIEVRLISRNGMHDGRPVDHTIPYPRIVGDSLRALRPMRGEPSAIDALMKYLEAEANFTEVTG